MLISIIIPVYNVSLFLEKCLNSVINQTFKNLQIILVDDGSTDNSGIICDNYSKKDSRIEVIHQKNKGLSEARNTGLSLARGEYITFVDSDDYIELDTYSTIFKAIIENKNPDLIFFRARTVNVKGKIIGIGGKEPTGKILKVDKEFSEKRIIGELDNGVWNKVYRAEIVKNIIFESGRVHGEDFKYNLEVLERVKTAINIDQIKYNYVKNPNSITRKSFNPKNFDQVYFKDLILEIVKEKFPKYLKISEKRAFLARLHICRVIYHEKLEKEYKTQLVEYDKYMDLYYNLIKNEMSFLEKTEYILYKNFKRIYKIFLIFLYSLKKIKTL